MASSVSVGLGDRQTDAKGKEGGAEEAVQPSFHDKTGENSGELIDSEDIGAEPDSPHNDEGARQHQDLRCGRAGSVEQLRKKGEEENPQLRVQDVGEHA